MTELPVTRDGFVYPVEGPGQGTALTPALLARGDWRMRRSNLWGCVINLHGRSRMTEPLLDPESKVGFVCLEDIWDRHLHAPAPNHDDPCRRTIACRRRKPFLCKSYSHYVGPQHALRSVIALVSQTITVDQRTGRAGQDG